MSKQFTYKAYELSELSEKAQAEAIEQLRYVQVEGDWWDAVYDDAKNVGLSIQSFDTGRAQSIEMTFNLFGGADQTARLIVENHGEGRESYRAAKAYQDASAAHAKKEPEPETEEREGWEDAQRQIEDNFLSELGTYYLQQLEDAYAYMTSDEGVKECIEANDYLFLENGLLDPMPSVYRYFAG